MASWYKRIFCGLTALLMAGVSVPAGVLAAEDGEAETDYDGVLEEIYTAVKHCADRARTGA